MSKKKKIFKQKIKQMLAEIERKTANTEATEKKRETQKEPEIKKPEATEIVKEKVEKPKSPPQISVSSLTPSTLVLSDLKKIAYLSGGMIFILVVVYLISTKTNWLLFMADKIYKWSGVG